MFSSTFNVVVAGAALAWTIVVPVSGLPQFSLAGRDVPFQPVMQDNFADPAIITVDGVIYTFATASAGVNIPMATNQTDGWHMIKSDSGQTQDAMPTLPAWCSGSIWAPDVVQRVSLPHSH
jgi:hypothetical protein